jgi:hypothetical protein
MHLDEVVRTPLRLFYRSEANLAAQVDGIVAFNALLSPSMLGIHFSRGMPMRSITLNTCSGSIHSTSKHGVRSCAVTRAA